MRRGEREREREREMRVGCEFLWGLGGVSVGWYPEPEVAEWTK